MMQNMEPDVWYEKAIDFHGLIEIPVSGQIAAHSALLPALHADPCDRIIVATARLHKLAILTPDETVKAYPDTLTAW